MDKGKRKGSRSKPLSEQREWCGGCAGNVCRRPCTVAGRPLRTVRTFKAAVAAEEKKAVALTKSIDQTRSQITALVRGGARRLAGPHGNAT